ncbi:MAG: hypothetical protein ACOCN7_02035 [Prevotella sp.]|nr:hypothetical protein [Prevotella sp.]
MQIKKLEHRLSDIEIGHGIIRALSQKRHVAHPKIIKLQFPVRLNGYIIGRRPSLPG